MMFFKLLLKISDNCIKIRLIIRDNSPVVLCHVRKYIT